MRRAVTGSEMRQIEQAYINAGGTLDALMERASGALAELSGSLAGGPVLVLAGPGNNGMDGLMAAARLNDTLPVHVYTFRRTDAGPFTGSVTRAEDDDKLDTLRRLLGESSVVVDALLGTGAFRPPEGLLQDVINACNRDRAQDSRVAAADIPTGVNADTGAVPGPAIRADFTLCMGVLKQGCVLYPGAEYAGELEVADIDLPDDLVENAGVAVPEESGIARMLPRRSADSNKGTYGRVLVVAGSRNFTGACALSSMAAYRIGAGLVEIATVHSVREAVAGRVLEAVFSTLPDENGQIGPQSLEQVREALPKARAVVVGPGLGQSDATYEFVHGLLQMFDDCRVERAVFDADALNQLSKMEDWWHVSTPLVLTPHPGEMSRLTGLPIAEIQADRVGVASRHAARWQKVIVLKGAGTVVAAPDGRVSINTTGGPNLATAGTGDVLSGTIGGLLAQGMDPFEAAVAGAFIHGRAGDEFRVDHGDAGTIAGDLLPLLPVVRASLMNELEEW